MKRVCTISLFLLLLPLSMIAQVETGGSQLPDKTVDIMQTAINQHFLKDSLRFQTDIMRPQLSIPREPQLVSYTHQIKQGATGLNLWKGASLGFYGATSQILRTDEHGNGYDDASPERRTMAFYSLRTCQ